MAFFFGRRRADGEILKAERMLVRIASIDDAEAKLPKEYSEGSHVNTRLKRVWREYYVVARVGESKHITLHIHKSRRIPATAHTHTRKSSRWQIHLHPDITRASLFSPLDKTIGIITPEQGKGYLVFIFNCQSLQSSTQWYAFIRQVLDAPPLETSLLITVPDLDNLQIRVNTARGGVTAIDERGQALVNGNPISANDIIERCMSELRKVGMCNDVLDYWEKNYEMGLCWKFYDRIEWLKGTHEPDQDELAASWALAKTHILELRPKVHYPTQVRLGVEERLAEPVPVEGFLIRLTAATGRQVRFGKLFFKRLYFANYDNLLFFCSPSKAAPPPPPQFQERPISENEEIRADKMPVIWATRPYRLNTDGQIQWLESARTPEDVQWYDEKAQVEYERCVHIVKSADGFIDLSHVKYVRTVKRNPTDEDARIGQGESVDFHAAELSTNDSEYAFEHGTAAAEFDDDRTFELVLENGLVIRLQAFDLETRREWMRRLRDLIKYWKVRLVQDFNSLKEMRSHNLEIIKIDKGNESRFMDWIRRYQLTEAVSAAGMYHFCRIANCRTLSIHGPLYAKFRRRQTFTNFMVVLTSRTLIIYEHIARSTRGIGRPRIHHSQIKSIDLRHCYVYSGQMVQSELMHQTTSLDPHLGYGVLPKLFRDGWTSVDDDISCAFALWAGKRRFAFRSEQRHYAYGAEKHQMASVGLPGDIVVFMARSRVERDLWVIALGQEINRHAGTVGDKVHVV